MTCDVAIFNFSEEEKNSIIGSYLGASLLSLREEVYL
jgi:hypothetical protein